MSDLATLEALSTRQLMEGYSDCYKSLYGHRPRHSDCSPRAHLLSFWLSYDANVAYANEQDAAELEALGFPTWTAYYAHLDAEYEEEGRRWDEARRLAQEHHTAFTTRWHTLPVIEAWEHGVPA